MPVLGFAAFDGIAHQRIEESPDREREQPDRQRDQQELPERLVRQPGHRTLTGGGLVLVAHGDADGEQADDRRDDALTHEPDAADRFLPVASLGFHRTGCHRHLSALHVCSPRHAVQPLRLRLTSQAASRPTDPE